MMRSKFLYVFTIILAFALSATVAFSQNSNSRAASAASDIYVISAKAGGVNYVEGNVAYIQNNGRTGHLLKGDALDVGEKVTTGNDGKTEILLNPGSYVRLGENSAFEFQTTSLDDLRLRLNRGSAVFEVITDNDFTVVVSTPKANFNIIKSGVYRVDVLNDGSGKIAVWKGLAQVGDGQATEIKSGREATVNQSDVAVVKFDRDKENPLDEWSKMRAKELAKANSRLERQDLRSNLISSFNNGNLNLFQSFGFWVFNNYTGSYCFLPFGYGWSSPYGYGFGRDLWYMRMPRYIYVQPPPTTTPGNNTARTGRDSVIPPYQRVENGARQKMITIDNDPLIFGSRQFPSAMPSVTGARPVTPAVAPNNGSRKSN